MSCLGCVGGATAACAATDADGTSSGGFQRRTNCAFTPFNTTKHFITLQIVPDVPAVHDILGLPLPHDAMLVSCFGMVLECLVCTFLNYNTHRGMTTSTLMTCLLMTKSTEAAASGGVLILGTDAHWCKIHIGQLGAY